MLKLIRSGRRFELKNCRRHLSSKGMRKIEFNEIFPYTRKQLFNVVLDVSQYKDFLPWVTDSVVLERNESSMKASLSIGFSSLSVTYISNILWKTNSEVIVEAEPGEVFKCLTNTWKLSPGPDAHSCMCEFSVAFEFKSLILSQVGDTVFSNAQKNVLAAFKKRCLTLHGKSESIYK